MDAKDIKSCPKCGGAWAGNITRCLYCGTYMPDPVNYKNEEK